MKIYKQRKNSDKKEENRILSKAVFSYLKLRRSKFFIIRQPVTLHWYNTL